jgi:hypothetical protein
MAQIDDTQLDDQASRPDPFEREDKEGFFNVEEDEPRLPGDYDRSPAAEPDDVQQTSISKADPRTDSGLDTQEIYDEGLANAADIDALKEDSDDDELPERVA